MSTIRKKYNDYTLNNNNIKSHVDESIKTIYKQNSEGAVKKLNEIQKSIIQNGY